MTAKQKYIYVKGKKIYVSNEIYKAYKKQLNHEAYLKRLDKKHGVFHFGEYHSNISDVVDKNIDIEKIIETKMRIEDLYRALEKLNDEERSVIKFIYFNEKTLVELAKQNHTNPMKISRTRDKILKKLRQLLDK